MRTRLVSLVALLAFASPPAVRAQERVPSNYVRMLIPVFSPQLVPGAFGSIWDLELILRNDGDAPLDVFPINQTCASSSVCNQTVRANPALAPKQTATTGTAPPLQLAIVGSARPRGGFLYVEAGRASQLSAQLTFADISRTPHEIVRLPVVQEADFYEGRHSILGVPVAPSGRATLRIYDDGSSSQSLQVVVRIFLTVFRIGPPDDPFRFDRPLAEEVFSFALQPDDCGFLFGCPAVRYQPGYLEIPDLLARFPALDAANDLPHGVRIEIESLSPGLRYWPMVTVTDNQTSHTTLYTVR